MSERKEFEMTEAQEAALLASCQPEPYIVMGGIPPRSVQERANDAWRALGDELGFQHMTVKPVAGKGQRFFTAMPRS